MGPCVTCGQPTEPDADFCPACAGYAAPATVYSYAPSRLSRSEGEVEQILALLPRSRAPALDQPAVPAEGRPPPVTGPAAPGTRPRAAELGARLTASARQRREGRWLVAAATLIVLIIAAGTVLLELGRHVPAGSPQARPADRASSPTGHPTTPAASAAVPPSPGPQITVTPAAASSPHETAVLSFLTSYFAAIDSHDFTAYQQLFSAPLRTTLSASAFSAGYGSTSDSAITLTSIGVAGSGGLVAQVTFVSHQQPAVSPTNSACTSWSVSLYLLEQGGSYLLEQPPPGYQASYTACS